MGISKELIEGLGIEEDWKNRFPQELSGGELQRFCIARALGKGTKYLLCDEITTMLDFITQGQIWNFLIEETKRRGIGMVIVSHSQPLFRPCLYQTDQIERESVTQKRDFVTKERIFHKDDRYIN